ncbi:hypothetical protein QYF36_010877 [Acer negundo]|nr:hypothetical protein QYF36_010877 [Acer negundo]
MANKVHPLPPSSSSSSSSSFSSSSSSSSSYVTSKREAFTIWMKSLVMHGNGCTVFNENGEIVYRIDNYEKKGSKEVYLMDLYGRILFTLRKVHFFGQWEGYQGDGTNNLNKEKPSFRVTRNGHVTLHYSNNGEAADCYRLEAMGGGKKSSSEFKIIDSTRGGRRVVAEAKRKQSSSGVVLGDDVFTLMVEPHVDHSLIMALVTVHGLMHHRL